MARKLFAPRAVLPLLLALGSTAAVAVVGRVRPRAAGAWALGGAVVVLAAVVASLAAPRADTVLPWAPTWGLQLVLLDDGLARLYMLLAAGVGLLVLWYARGYLPHDLERHHRPSTDAASFFALLALFLAAMLGVATAGDLVLLFFFFDLTAVCSYYLIAYHRQDQAARAAALLSLLLTGISAVLLLVAAAVCHVERGTFAILELAREPLDGAPGHAVAAMIAGAAIVKSAQAPLHFWLPRAMTAPTPVSAYLHSAAMVAAGVLVLQRTHGLVAASRPVLDALMWIGAASMFTGGLLALSQRVVKQVLAYSTVAQYGYVVLLLGIGTPAALGAAAFHVPAHALAKSAWFMVAGAVTHATGETELGAMSGLRRRLPVLAAAAAVASATLAGLPLTVGFFKDELLFGAAHGPAAALAVCGATLSVAYAWRLWSAVFAGEARPTAGAVPRSMLAPIVVLAAGAVLLGVWPGFLADGAAAAASVPRELVEVAYHFDLRRTNRMALAALTTGFAVWCTRRWWEGPLAHAAHRLERLSPTHAYRIGLQGLNRLSDRMHALEVRDLRDRVAAVLVPLGVLVFVGLWASGAGQSYRSGSFGSSDLPLALVLVAMVATTLGAAGSATHIGLVLLLSLSGLLMSVAFALLEAPDVALVSALVGTVTTLVVLATILMFPRADLRAWSQLGSRRRDHAFAGLATLAAFLLTWLVLSEPDSRTAADRYVELAPRAHARDVVTAILADFRGLDTLGEVTVVFLALLGITVLLGSLRTPRVQEQAR